MIRDGEEVERRSGELDVITGGMPDRLAFGEAVGVIGRRPYTEDIGVKRIAGMHVHVAEIGVACGICGRRRDFGRGYGGFRVGSNL